MGRFAKMMKRAAIHSYEGELVALLGATLVPKDLIYTAGLSVVTMYEGMNYFRERNELSRYDERGFHPKEVPRKEYLTMGALGALFFTLSCHDMLENRLSDGILKVLIGLSLIMRSLGKYFDNRAYDNFLL